MVKSRKNKNVFAALSVVVIGVICFNTSCKHTNQYPKETATLDSIGKALHKVDSVLEKMDSAKIKSCVDKVIICMDYVKMYGGGDSMSSTATEILRSYSTSRWELQKFLGKRTMLHFEMNKSMKQVDHLSHDMQNGLVPKDSAMFYFGYEAKKGRELMEAANYGMNIVGIQMPMNEMIAPHADSLINRLKNHQKI